MKQKIHFLTYSDNKKYAVSKKHILGLAKKSEIFETCQGKSKNDLGFEFIQKYRAILEQDRGSGYYLWKPRIILQKLNEISIGDIVVYTDAGSSFNFYAKSRFFDYIEMLNSSDFGNLRFESKKNYLEKYWTNKEIFKQFNIKPESPEGNTVQLMGGHLIFKKNQHSLDFLNHFFEIIDTDNDLITDFYKKNQISGFNENRHDQSIMSLISKVYGGIILENETYFEKGSVEQKSFPFLSVRHYGHGLEDRIKYFFFYKKNVPIFF